MPKILLIESDRQLASYARNFLDNSGYETILHYDLQTAISVTDSQKPDVIILNLQLAARSGIEFLYELRSYPDWQSLPVIVVGQLSKDEAQAYKEAFDELEVTYLHKPALSLQQTKEAIESISQPLAV